MAKKPFKEKDSAPTGPLCACKQLAVEYGLRKRANPTEIARLKRLIWRECWNCLGRDSKADAEDRDPWAGNMGCSKCTPRPHVEEDFKAHFQKAVCPRCRVYTESIAFIFGAETLSPEDFDRHPPEFRFEYWAVWNPPDPAWWINIRTHLRDPSAQSRVNRVLRYLGKDPYSFDPITGFMLETEEDRVRAGEMLAETARLQESLKGRSEQEMARIIKNWLARGGVGSGSPLGRYATQWGRHKERK